MNRLEILLLALLTTVRPPTIIKKVELITKISLRFFQQRFCVKRRYLRLLLGYFVLVIEKGF